MSTTTCWRCTPPGSATASSSSLLFEVRPGDPLVYVAAAATLMTVSLLAAWLPARRATTVDPIVALRAE